MPLSSFIKINDPKYKFDEFKRDVKDMVHDKIVKLRATNKKDENLAIVLDHQNQVKSGYNKQYNQKYYSKNKDWILQKKKVYALKNKEHIAAYHARYWQEHKEELKLKHREYLKNRKNNNNKLN
jgi:hypothetical protein